ERLGDVRVLRVINRSGEPDLDARQSSGGIDKVRVRGVVERGGMAVLTDIVPEGPAGRLVRRVDQMLRALDARSIGISVERCRDRRPIVLELDRLADRDALRRNVL